MVKISEDFYQAVIHRKFFVQMQNGGCELNVVLQIRTGLRFSEWLIILLIKSSATMQKNVGNPGRMEGPKKQKTGTYSSKYTE